MTEGRSACAEGEWIFIADAHLTGRQQGEMEAFVRFLGREKERINHLVILGDLFEFLFGFKTSAGREFPYPEYLSALGALQALQQRGIEILYVEGNHDFHLDAFFRESLGMNVTVYPRSAEIRLGEISVYLSHGDLLNSRQWKYRLFRRALRNRWTYGLMELAGPRLVRSVAERMGRKSYEKYHRLRFDRPPPAFLSFARQKFLQGYDAVILGHSHFPEAAEEEINGKRHLYFNVGDWMIRRSYLRFNPRTGFELSKFEDQAER